MGEFIISVGEGGLKRPSPSDFMISGFVFGGVATGELALNTVSDELSNLAAVEALGIDADYDADNDVLVWYHLKEFFRLSPSGKVRFMLVAQGVTLTQMADKTNSYLQKLVEDSEGKLRRAGLVLNPEVGYTSTLDGGLDGDVITAIPKAQELALQAFADKRPLQIIIEGREFNGTPSAADDLRALEGSYVGVTILQDPDAVTAFALHGKSAAVGTTIGCMSFVNPNESIGWTGKCNLSDVVTGEFASVNISSGALASTVEADYAVLTQKGFTFGRNYAGQAGVYFDDYPTLALITSDYAYGQEVAVIIDASRRVYNQLFPRINGPVKIDPANGQIEPDVAKEIEADGGSALDIMVQSSWISGYDVFVDPTQDIQSTGILEVQFDLVSIATGRTIRVKIGFTKTIG